MFAKKARDTQGLRNTSGKNKRGLVKAPAQESEQQEQVPRASPAVRYLAIFLIFVLLGGCMYTDTLTCSRYGDAEPFHALLLARLISVT